MTKIEMAKIALKDFKKFGESKKCRFYKNIIGGLKSIPCGVRNPNKLTEFYEFIPANMRKGVSRDKIVEIVLQFYVGYSDAMNNEELKKLIQKRYARMYYQKNRPKFLDSAKKSHLKNRKKRLKAANERYHADPEYYRVRYAHKAEEYRFKNRENRNAYNILYREIVGKPKMAEQKRLDKEQRIRNNQAWAEKRYGKKD